MHDFAAGVSADRRGAQARRKQTNRENRADHRAEHMLDGPLRAFDGVGAGHAVQRVRGEDEQREVDRTGQYQRPGNVDFAAVE